MKRQQTMLVAALLTTAILGACGGGGSGGGSDSSLPTATPAPATPTPVATPVTTSPPTVISTTTCPAISLSATDAQTLTGASTPMQTADYHRENNSKILPFQVINKLHGYKYIAAPVLPTWQFASTDPTSGGLSTLECDIAPDTGWHSYKRTSGTAATITHGKVAVTGGRNAAKENIYTVFNGQQLIAAINDAGLKPKIIRVVGHIDLRYSENNSVFKEYISYTDQKYGGSINIPSNTTLVGINDANGKPARITGTTILVGGELPQTAGGDPEADFKAWIAAGNDGDLYPTWTRNVIIRNLKIDTPWDVDPEDSGNGYADGVTISRAQNIWVDHVTISDGDTPDTLASDTRHDGALDVVRGSDYVSVTNSIFADHGKNTLVGNGDAGRAWSDQDRLHVTFSGLWWKGVASRHPLIRFGQLHTYNNLMEGSTTSTALGHKFEGGLDVRYQSSVFSENNFHYFTGLKPKEVCGKLSGSTDGKGFRVKGAQFISDKDDNGKTWATTYTGALDITTALAAASCTEMPTADIAWTPPYSYTAQDANTARAAIEVNTGAGRVGLNAVLGTARDISGGATSATPTPGTGSTPTPAPSTTPAPSSAPGVASSWTEDFASADATNFYTPGYKALPDDTSVAMYYKGGGTPAFSGGIMTLTGSRITIGARATTGTTSGSTPGGIFNINGKTCSITINTSEAGVGAGKFQIYVDNNTTTGGNSVHGANSKVVDVVASTIVSGTNTWPITLNTPSFTGGSFLMLRTESSATIKIDSASLSCN